MNRTKPLTLILLAVLGTVVAWFLETALVTSSQPVLTPPFTLAIALVLIGVTVVIMALPVRRVARGTHGRIDPFYATRVVVLAKASSLSGAVLAGGGVGISVFLLTRSVVPGATTVFAAIAMAVGALVLLGGGLVAESMCALPPDDTASNHDARPGNHGTT